MLLKGLFRGGDDSGSESGSSHSGGGGGGGRRESAFGKVARVLLPNANRRERGSTAPYFNPEEHISQKREWSRRYTQQGGGTGAAGGEDRLHEHFAVVGLPPDMNIREVAADIKTYQRLNRAAGSGGSVAAAAGGLEVTADTPREEKQRQYGLKGPALQAQVLYTLPSSPAMPPDLAQSLAAFCFPHGVRPELLERTPSMSALNEVIYSQPYQTHDDQSFVFLMKVTEPGSVEPRTLYGVCCYVRELVHRPPSMAREAYPGCNAPLTRYLVVAPRCYCLLTHHPFFALHFRVLQTILGLERLERMTSFAATLAGLDGQLSPPDSSNHPASSGGAPSATSTASVNQQHPAAAATAALPAAAGAPPVEAAGPGAVAAAEEEDGSEGSSRRWTEGSGPEEAQPAQLDGLARALQQLGLGDEERPSRRAQVSPHWPAPQAVQAPLGQPTAASTPTDQGLPGATVGETPFFTPAGLGSATASPTAHAYQLPGQQQQQDQQQQQAGGWQAEDQAMPTGTEAAAAQPPGSAGASPPGGTRRALEEVLAEVGSSGSSPAGPAGVAPGAQGASAGRLPVLEAELAAPAGSRASSRAGSRQRRAEQPGEDDGSASDAESYLTASSSTALLALQSRLDASPLPPGLPGRLAQELRVHERALSAGSAAGLAAAGASPLQAGWAGSPPPTAAAPAGAARVYAEPGQATAAQALLPDLDTESFTLHPVDQQQQQQQQQQQREQEEQRQLDSRLEDPPPLLQLAESQSAGDMAEQQQPAEPPLIELLGDAGPQQQRQQPDQQKPGLELQVVTSTISSSTAAAAAAAAASTPPRPDLLAGALLLHGEQPSALAELQATGPAEAAQHTGQAAELQDRQQPADAACMPPPPPRLPHQGGQLQGQAQQQGQHQGQGTAAEGEQVVRVMVKNVDLSRPLCSADLLALYRASVVPQPGQLFEFQPDPGLQTIRFRRPNLLRSIRELGLRPSAACLPDIDAAENLGGWAVAALCRAMSLDNLLTFLTAALLERQMVVFCPNAGLLSGIVLSLIPLLLPFHWQSLLLPVLPAGEGRLELVEAPVPFVLGVLYKTPEVRAKCGGLVRVNVYKDKVKNAGSLPPLPQQAALMDALAGSHAELRRLGLMRAAATRPVHMITDKQQAMAEGFLATLKRYLQGLVADLPAYCITDVSSTMERTSVLLKDSFVESFPPRDRPFMRQFAETQMFSVYCDAAI